jgi:hypothetical protein
MELSAVIPHPLYGGREGACVVLEMIDKNMTLRGGLC